MAVSTWKTEGSIAKLLAWRVAEAPEADFVCVEDDGPFRQTCHSSRARQQNASPSRLSAR